MSTKGWAPFYFILCRTILTSVRDKIPFLKTLCYCSKLCTSAAVPVGLTDAQASLR